MSEVKEFPQSRDAEMAFIWTIINNWRISIKANIKDFYFEDTKKTYRVLKKMDEDNIKIDLITLPEKLKDEWVLDWVWGLPFIIDCVNMGIYNEVPETYFKIMREKATKRELIELSTRLTKAGQNLNGNELLDELSKTKNELDKIGENIVDDSGSDMDLLASEYIQFANDNIEKQKQGNKTIGFRTWIPMIDENCDGLQPWTVMRLNAYTNVGKTRFTVKILANLLAQWIPCAFFSTEVVKKLFITNLISTYFWVSYWDVKYWNAQDKINMDELLKLPLKFFDDKFELSEIMFLCKKLKPKVVFIDFAQNIDAGAIGEEYKNMTLYAREIQKFAIQNNIAVFDISQINNEAAKDWKTSVMGMNGSGKLAHSADVVLHLKRNEMQITPPPGVPKYKVPVILDIVLQKNKYWPNQITSTIKADFDNWGFEDITWMAEGIF